MESELVRKWETNSFADCTINRFFTFSVARTTSETGAMRRRWRDFTQVKENAGEQPSIHVVDVQIRPDDFACFG